ncbi:hypothetical protein [Thermus thermophilus]|uniref:hypothetical protein n=1 Tax=Thermus thermophilus TaxID=274 RepID=UPI0002F4C936|nr:hypothetical protein [Thermus thermophilus]
MYGRLQNPGEDPECYSLGDLVLCPEASAGEGLGEIAFQGGDQAPFALEGETLTQGVRQGELWFGLRVKGALPPGLSEIRLEELKARVTVGL